MLGVAFQSRVADELNNAGRTQACELIAQAAGRAHRQTALPVSATRRVMARPRRKRGTEIFCASTRGSAAKR
jgi:hypothetical protein